MMTAMGVLAYHDRTADGDVAASIMIFTGCHRGSSRFTCAGLRRILAHQYRKSMGIQLAISFISWPP